ncbi:unnamed protein product [Clavelina lepadiformis]|uniref:Y+L amino acid transporter 2 n=1 Tax=Clavelina lepadiformis TaxID=159417 RepID=A0ABP0GF92_CLALP
MESSFINFNYWHLICINNLMMSSNEGLETSPPEAIKLKKKITLINGVTLIIGNIIGSGIFLTPKGVQERCGSPGLSLIIWSICGVFSLVGALCYAELGTTIVKSGASYAYILEAFGPLVGFVRLWISVLIIEPTVQAVIAITFATYLIQPFYPTCEPPFVAVRLLAAVCMIIIMLMNCWSVRYGTRIQDVFAYAKVFALIVIIITGIVFLFNGKGSGSLSKPWAGTTSDVGDIAFALYSGLYSYAGWDTLNFMVEELQDPYRNLPRAIFISMPICTLIYLFANVAYYAVLTPADIIASDAVAVGFAGKTLGVFSWIIPIFVAMSTFGALNSSLMASSRLFFTGAREQHLPDYFAMVSPDHFTPVPSLLLSGCLTLVYLCVGDIFKLINYYSFMYWLTVGLSIIGQIYLRYKRPDLPRPLKVNIIFPIIFSLACCFLVIVPFYSETVESLIGTAILLTGVPIYFYFIYLNPGRRPACLHSVTHHLTCFLQKIFPVVMSESDLEGEF